MRSTCGPYAGCLALAPLPAPGHLSDPCLGLARPHRGVPCLGLLTGALLLYPERPALLFSSLFLPGSWFSPGSRTAVIRGCAFSAASFVICNGPPVAHKTPPSNSNRGLHSWVDNLEGALYTFLNEDEINLIASSEIVGWSQSNLIPSLFCFFLCFFQMWVDYFSIGFVVRFS